ncbi:hypothetical protein [Streptomyces sp. NBC_00996]|uniref:hypothetical protein n=1 Tax=Streptomyces sp. NBC_00996 TaxID=2903710 RepID=UPI00386CC36E|nr:hypothetical protein OG390_17340 [Streptomyces sp. NBC_00996]
MPEQWFTVELQSGGTASQCGGHWNREQAEALADGAASKTDETVLVVAHTRTVAATYRRTVEITVARTDGAADGDA